MNALAIHLYLIIRYINLSFNYFGNFTESLEEILELISPTVDVVCMIIPKLNIKDNGE